MFKLLLLGVGIMLLIEGAMYALYPNQMKKMMKVVCELDNQKIRNIAMPICLIGFFLIYFNVKE